MHFITQWFLCLGFNYITVKEFEMKCALCGIYYFVIGWKITDANFDEATLVNSSPYCVLPDIEYLDG